MLGAIPVLPCGRGSPAPHVDMDAHSIERLSQNENEAESVESAKDVGSQGTRHETERNSSLGEQHFSPAIVSGATSPTALAIRANWSTTPNCMENTMCVGIDGVKPSPGMTLTPCMLQQTLHGILAMSNQGRHCWTCSFNKTPSYQSTCTG